MTKLVDMKVYELLDLTASDAPAPGGGSVAALSGAFAAALGQMVIRLSLGKKAFLALAEDRQEALKAALESLALHHQRLQALVDKDTEAFAAYMQAMKLPKDSDEDKAKRKEAMQAAARVSMETPLETAGLCVEALRELPRIARDGNKNAITDCGSAALLARAACEAAVLNVRINLSSVEDEQVRAAAAEKAQKLLLEAEQLKLEVLTIVEEKL